MSVWRVKLLRRCLHLDSHQPVTELGDKIKVRAVPEWDSDERARSGEPLDRGGFTKVSLLSGG